MKEFKEKNAWIEFRKYLQKFIEEGQKKPFNCPYLVVLTETIKYEDREYQKGEIICYPKVGSEGIVATTSCCVKNGIVIPGKLKEIKAYCDWNNSRFVLSIVGFEFNKK